MNRIEGRKRPSFLFAPVIYWKKKKGKPGRTPDSRTNKESEDPSMKRIISLLSAFLLIKALLAPAATAQTAEEYPPAGTPVVFEARDLKDNPVTSEEIFSGHILTMVNLWGTYCGPCINEMSDLGRLAKDVAGKGVQIIGLLSDATDAGYSPVPEKVEQAKRIVEETKADYPHLLPSDDLCRKVIWQLSAVPTTFFVDETGMPVGSAYVGARSYDAWADVIDQVLEQTQE